MGDHITGLDISCNGLRGALTLENLSQLTSLNASYNQLSSIGSLSGLSNLYYLYLSHKQISKIENLDALVNLSTLNLDGNNLPLSELANHRSIPAINSVAKSDYNMYWYQAGLAAGYEFRAGDNAIISPSLGVAYLGSHSQGFTEKNAGNLNLEVDKENLNSFEVQALVDAETTITTASGFAIKPRLKLGLAYELADKNASIHTRFSEIPEIGGFEAESADVGRLRFIGGLGVDMSLSETVSFAVDYETSLQQDYQYHQGSVSLKFEF